MNHIVNFSGGVGSWAAARRVADQKGTENLTLLFADVIIEDDDLYTFLVNAASNIYGIEPPKVVLEALKDLPPVGRMEERKAALSKARALANEHIRGLAWIADGRSPWEVFKDERYIGNTRKDPCSKILKRNLLDKYRDSHFSPHDTVAYFGIDWTEEHRIERVRERIKPWRAEAPLCDAPYLEKDQILAQLVQLGIKPPRLYGLGFPHGNCFDGGERFLTDQGVMSFGQAYGREVKVLGVAGGWKSATIQKFGKQELVYLNLQRRGERKTILTTENHRWFVRSGRTKRIEKLTKQLKAGSKLFSMYAQLQASVRPSAFGIAHGIVFGDGCASTGKWNNPARITLCGKKDAQLLKWFPLSPTSIRKGVGVNVMDLPRTWKEKPSLKESKSYLYGWLAGYFAADGTATGGQFKISSGDRSNLEFVGDVCAILGIGVNKILEEKRLGLGKVKTSLFTVALIADTLRSDFFLIDKHRKRFEEQERIRPAEWEVAGVKKSGIVRDVYCAVVPDGHAFTLESNIFTGNCGGTCVKAGQAQFHLLLKTIPEHYEEWERQELAMREYLGKDVSILRDRRGGTTKSLTLKAFRERLEKDGTDYDKTAWGGCGCAVG